MEKDVFLCLYMYNNDNNDDNSSNNNNNNNNNNNHNNYINTKTCTKNHNAEFMTPNRTSVRLRQALWSLILFGFGFVINLPDWLLPSNFYRTDLVSIDLDRSAQIAPKA